MLKIDSIIENQYSCDETVYTFKSESDSSLYLKIFKPDMTETKEIEFTAFQLRKIYFHQKILKETKSLPLLLIVLSSVQEGILELVKNKSKEKNLLKPLQENHSLTFRLSESDPYGPGIPCHEWCQAVSSFPDIQSNPSYEKKIQECKEKMSIHNTEEDLSEIEQEYLEKIDRAVNKILKEMSKKTPDKHAFTLEIKTIQENIYQLVVMPIIEVVAFAQSLADIFVINQHVFRDELKKKLPDPKNKIYQKFLHEIHQAMSDNRLETISQALVKKYPSDEAFIDELTKLAQFLLKQAKDEALSQVNQYDQRPEIQNCLKAIFSERPELANKYHNMLQGQYSSLKEIPRGFSNGKIHVASYISNILTLSKGCTAFDINQLQEFKECCEGYFQQKKSTEHFQNNIQPLILFLQCIKNILLWPQEYELAEKEVKFIERNLFFLMAISNPAMTKGRSLIPYQFLSISKEDQKKAKDLFINKKSSLDSKRIACRTLLHARIPWQVLQAIGSLLHQSGGIPEKTVHLNQELVRSSILDVIPELPELVSVIEELIEFEVTEFSNIPLKIPVELRTGCFAHLYLLGNTSEIKRNIEKAVEILAFWRNRSLRKDDFATPKIKHAILRTIQILGEICKNLSNCGILSRDSIWNDLEELRDFLSHSERFSVDKRLTILIDESSDKVIKIFSNIFENFQSLLEYFESIKSTFNNAKTWTDRQKLYNNEKKKLYLELKGLEDLCIFLAARIPEEDVDELQKSVEKECAIENRKDIAHIKEIFMRGSFEQVMDIDKLPLNLNQQKELKKAIKITTSKIAAVNDAKAAKPGILDSVKTLIKEFRKNKKLECSYTELDRLDKHLLTCNIDSPDDFQDKIEKAKDFLKDIKQIWTNNHILQPSKIETIEEKLSYLTETLESYIDRKKHEIESILQSMQIYFDQSKVKEEADSLIRLMQLCQIKSEDLKLKLIGLGVTGPEFQAWEKAYNKVSLKTGAQSQKNKEEGKSVLETSKKIALQCIKVIMHRLQRLDHLLLDFPAPNRFNAFEQDPLIQLACQHLVADFRKKAALLEDCLEPIKQFQPFSSQFFQEIQNSLLSSIKIGNDILHVHEVRNPSTLTASGKKFLLYNHISQLLTNFSGGENHDVSINSLSLKLKQLEQYLIEIVPMDEMKPTTKIINNNHSDFGK